jgi:hypothetical protein
MATPFARTVGLALGLVTWGLGFGALAGWSASAETPPPVDTGVVDAFIEARARQDVAGITRLLDDEVRIVDNSRRRSGGPEVFYQVLPVGDTLEFGPRSVGRDGAVLWTEVVIDDGRSSWENNLNWWLDDNPLAEMVPSSQPTIVRREMRAVVVHQKIVELAVELTGGPADAT